MTLAAALAQQLEYIDRLVPGPPIGIDALDLTGTASFASAFEVTTAALVSAAASNLASGGTALDRDRVAALMSGYVEIDGAPVPKWAHLSGYYRTAGDRFIQLHCNFSHHAGGIVKLLGCQPTRDAVQEALLTLDAEDFERRAIATGMIAARVRTLEEWNAHPHARATVNLPLIEVEQIGACPPRSVEHELRVLDCSRVLAGPIAGQALAAFGADVLRVGGPRLPTVKVAVLATGFGKRNTFVDLDTAGGRTTFRELLDGADVWIDAYRPGAFADRGFEQAGPGSVTVQISAFDWVGPWAGRRGFDSIVQSTTGIVDAGRLAANASEPTPLPVQLLDYATGLLASFAAQKLVAHQREAGGTWRIRLSLLRTRNWLVSLGGPTTFEPASVIPAPAAMHTVDTDFGQLTAPLPIGGVSGSAPQPPGSASARWRT